MNFPKLQDLARLSVVLFALAIPIFSQQTSGNLVGTVYDPTTAPSYQTSE